MVEGMNITAHELDALLGGQRLQRQRATDIDTGALDSQPR